MIRVIRRRQLGLAVRGSGRGCLLLVVAERAAVPGVATTDYEFRLVTWRECQPVAAAQESG